MRIKLYAAVLWCVMVCALAPVQAQNYSDSALDTLVGPIALYPDPLLSNVIKASTFPSQVLAASGTNVVDPGWDSSVAALDDYPGVLTFMAGNSDWMNSLGWASSHQLSDLMDAVQRFRYKAQVAGNLSSNSQIQVIQEGTTIRIEPANPQLVYVPTYDPDQVQVGYAADAIAWGAGIATSAYLWNNVYHWNTNTFYSHPYGWYPPAGYYRPYGWQTGGIYGGAPVRLYGDQLVRGPVTYNNTWVGVNANTNRSAGYRPAVTPAGGYADAEIRASISRASGASWAGYRASDRSFGQPGLSSYGAAGATMRESERGAFSRDSFSVGSGYRGGFGGGGFRGGRR